eukprot:7022851-Lingulodinium_polyedra.AAC.1
MAALHRASSQSSLLGAAPRLAQARVVDVELTVGVGEPRVVVARGPAFGHLIREAREGVPHVHGL